MRVLFLYDEQEFQLNSSGRKKDGFRSSGAFRKLGKKIIMPHERTMPKYSMDRLELLRATEPIWSKYSDF